MFRVNKIKREKVDRGDIMTFKTLQYMIRIHLIKCST